MAGKTLGAAWADLTSALPPGWTIYALRRHYRGGWEVEFDEPVPNPLTGDPQIYRTPGPVAPTPVEALEAAEKKFREKYGK